MNKNQWTVPIPFSRTIWSLENCLTVLVFLLFACIQIGLYISRKSELVSAAFIIAVFCCAAVVQWKLTEIVLPRILTRCILLLSLTCATYILLQFPLIPTSTGTQKLSYLAIAMWMSSLLFCTLVYRYPALIIAPASYIPWIKNHASLVSGFQYRNDLDLIPLHQVSLTFGITAAVLYVAGSRYKLAFEKLESTSYRIVFVLISFHLAGYLFSGLEKAMLDGGWLSWALENNVANIFNVAMFNQQLIWQEFESLKDITLSILEWASRPLSVAILLAQLAAFTVFLNKRYAISILLLYDTLHLGILFLVGANFLTWVLVNTILIVAVSSLPKAYFRLSSVMMALLLMCFCQFAFKQFYKVPNLGWYDSLAVNRMSITATDGKDLNISIPPTHFLFFSYPFSHMSFGLPPGHYYPSLTNGGTDYYEYMQRASTCSFKESQLHSEYEQRWDADDFDRFIRRYHAMLTDLPPGIFELLHRSYWHHFWPPLANFLNHTSQNLTQMKLDDTKAYTLTVEPVCISINSTIRHSLDAVHHVVKL